MECNEFLYSLFLFIDNEIKDEGRVQSIELHFQHCPPCLTEMEREREILVQMKELLVKECQEAAP